MAEMLVILSSSFVSSKKFNKFQSILNDTEIDIMNQKELMLDENQFKEIPMENSDEFFDGAVVAYHINRNKNEINLTELIQTNKLLGKNDDINDILFETYDEYFITKLNSIFFNENENTELEQTMLFIKPKLNVTDLENILDTLKNQQIFVLDNTIFKIEYNDIYKNIFDDDSKAEYGTQIVCEGFNVINNIKLLIGSSNKDLYDYCQNTLNVKYNDKYSFYSLKNTEEACKFIDVLYPNYFNVERTLAIIKPTAVANNYANDITNIIKQYNFTIIAQKSLKLSVQQAQSFYAEHNGKSFFEELTTFMSSSAVMVFVLERVKAINCWRTLIGPTNTFTAKELAPNSIRGQYGTDKTANACHGSDSILSSEQEILFYFPEILSNMIKKPENIVESYLNQQLNDTGKTLNSFLVDGLTELAKTKPGNGNDVIEYFANWLLNNNPKMPKIVETEINFDELNFIDKIKYNNNNKYPKCLFVICGPGSNKTNQCQYVCKTFDYYYININSIISNYIKDNTINDDGKESNNVDGTNIISNDVVLKLIENEMIQSKKYKFVFDGFPSQLEQAITFDKDLCESLNALYIKYDTEVLKKNCLDRNNKLGLDETEDTITKRIKSYFERMNPVIEYFESKKTLSVIDVLDGDNDEVLNQRIKTALCTKI